MGTHDEYVYVVSYLHLSIKHDKFTRDISTVLRSRDISSSAEMRLNKLSSNVFIYLRVRMRTRASYLYVVSYLQFLLPKAIYSFESSRQPFAIGVHHCRLKCAWINSLQRHFIKVRQSTCTCVCEPMIVTYTLYQIHTFFYRKRYIHPRHPDNLSPGSLAEMRLNKLLQPHFITVRQTACTRVSEPMIVIYTLYQIHTFFYLKRYINSRHPDNPSPGSLAKMCLNKLVPAAFH